MRRDSISEKKSEGTTTDRAGGGAGAWGQGLRVKQLPEPASAGQTSSKPAGAPVSWSHTEHGFKLLNWIFKRKQASRRLGNMGILG